MNSRIGHPEERGAAGVSTGETATTPAVITADGAGPEIDVVEEWGQDSFPASDPPQNW